MHVTFIPGRREGMRARAQSEEQEGKKRAEQRERRERERGKDLCVRVMDMYDCIDEACIYVHFM